MSQRPSKEAIEAARSVYEQSLTPEEFAERVAAELSETERAEKLALIDWFQRRFPLPRDRLAYAERMARAVRARQG